MTRAEVLQQIDALLQAHGRSDLASELGRIAAASERANAQATNVAAVTRALLENEKTYRLVFAHERDPMSLFDVTTGMFLEVNAAWVALYGYSREEALGMRVSAVSAEPAETQKAIARLPAGETTRIDVRWHRAKDGTVFPVELTSGKLTLGERPVAYAVMRDITQQKDAERKLARSEARFRALIESMPDGVIVHRLGALVYMSPSARRMLGYTPDEPLEGRMAIAIVHPDDRASVLARWAEMIGRGVSAPPREERLLRKDGSSIVAEVAAHSTVFDGEPAILAIARDATARKAIEARLVMNDRLASLGRLAASIGHELNNPLAYVLGNVELMQREIDRAAEAVLDAASAARLRQHGQIIWEGATRMRDIVRDLKRLARGETEPPAPIDIESILEVCITMAEREIRARAQLVRDFHGRPFALGSDALFGQVFLNLLMNAVQAIPPGEPEGNTIRITTESTDTGEVVVEVCDTGCGIADEHRDRIFEPFFTTKVGDGTGLGLSICHHIVTAAGGTLAAHANPERGTTFRVTLPAVRDPG